MLAVDSVSPKSLEVLNAFLHGFKPMRQLNFKGGFVRKDFKWWAF